MDVSPYYVDIVSIPTAKLIHAIVPDVQIVLFARSAGDIRLSGLEMYLCRGDIDCNSADLKGINTSTNSIQNNCTDLQKRFVRQAQLVARQGREKAIQLRNNPDFTVDIDHPLGIFLAKGAFAWPLKNIWFKVFPKSQVSVVSSEHLFSDPRRTYDKISTAALLPFRITLVDGTKERPQNDKACKCDGAHVRSALEECAVQRAYNCGWIHANAHLAAILNESWPLAWNKDIDGKICIDIGFAASDLYDDIFKS